MNFFKSQRNLIEALENKFFPKVLEIQCPRCKKIVHDHDIIWEAGSIEKSRKNRKPFICVDCFNSYKANYFGNQDRIYQRRQRREQFKAQFKTNRRYIEYQKKLSEMPDTDC